MLGVSSRGPGRGAASGCAATLTFLWRLRQAHPVRAALLLLVAAGVTLAFQVYTARMYMANAWWVAAAGVRGDAGDAGDGRFPRAGPRDE